MSVFAYSGHEEPPDAILWTEDGEPYFESSGEMLSPDDLLRYGINVFPPPPLPIMTREDIDLALSKRQAIEVDMAALVKRREIHLANLNCQIGKLQRKLDWWDRQYAESIGKLTAKALEGKRDRHIQYDFGRVSIGKKKGSVKITDMQAAVDWVRALDPGKVRFVEQVTATSIKELTAHPEDLHFVVVVPPSEQITIDTDG